MLLEVIASVLKMLKGRDVLNMLHTLRILFAMSLAMMKLVLSYIFHVNVAQCAAKNQHLSAYK